MRFHFPPLVMLNKAEHITISDFSLVNLMVANFCLIFSLHMSALIIEALM